MKFFRFFFLISIMALLAMHAESQGHFEVVDLSGTWKFATGDSSDWSNPNYDDSEWEDLYVPLSIETGGFPGYDGFAWYRKTFTIPRYIDKDKLLSMHLGYIDDADQVYLNGEMIGKSGCFPPEFVSAHDKFRDYPLPNQYLNYEEENVIAVRLFDHKLTGGIVRGEININTSYEKIPMEIDLRGPWKFMTGDSIARKSPDFDDSEWGHIMVPARWEDQQDSLERYNGFAWYRKTFNVSDKFQNEDIVVFVGKVDDLDETYLNGELLNNVKRMKNGPEVLEDDWKNYSAYYIPGNKLKPNSQNTIAVRVFDDSGAGGIYEGPVGIAFRKKFTEYWKGYN